MIKFLIQLMVAALLFAGCGGSTAPSDSQQSPHTQQEKPGSPVASTPPQNGGGQSDKTDDGKNGDPRGGGSDGSSDEDSPELSVNSVRSFTLNTKNVLNLESNQTGLNGFHVKIERAGELVYDNVEKPLDVKLVLNQDDSITFNGFDDIKEGDKVTFIADGFTPQQKIVDQAAENSKSMTFVLKPVDSRQTFVLGDLDSGRVTSRFTQGAGTKVSGDKVIFETNNANVKLSVDKAAIESLINKVKRSPKADKNTKIYLDITSIDPKTELDSTIGDFTYDSGFEPSSSRVASAVGSNDTMLESVVMTSISMTTSNGDEIHCFGGGTFDEEKQECVGDSSKATLRMKIPASQFELYAKKYNQGERVVPLYHYSQSKATWIRQVDSDKNPIDGELILEDNDNNQKANSGDTLYIEGEVGHFSYWNGDYPRERTCLKGSVKLTDGSYLPDGTVVVSKGSDYTGRKFRESVFGENLSFDGLGAKADAKVELYLQYPNHTKSKSIFVQTARNDDGSCQDVGELLSDYQVHKVDITVVDKEANVLENASVKVASVTKMTSEEGKVSVFIGEEGLTAVTASYDTGEFITSATKYVNGDSQIVLDTSSFTISGLITFKNQNGEVVESEEAYVEIEGDGFYKKVFAKNGKYTIKIPSDKIKSGSTVKISSGIFVPLYAKTMTKNEELTIGENDKKESKKSHDIEFTLEAFIVSGRVTDPFASQGEKGLAGITIYSDDQIVQSDDSGYYEMVLFDRQKVHKLYAYDPSSGDTAKPEPLIVPVNPSDDDLKDNDFIIDKREASISGVVLNMKGVPVQGIVLYTGIGWYSTVTDEEGKFEFHISDKNLFDKDIKIFAYDSADQTQVLAQKALQKQLQKGVDVDVGEITINNNLPPVIDSVTTTTPMLHQPMVITVGMHDPENDALEAVVVFDGKEYEVQDGEVSIIPDEVGTLEYTIIVREIDTSDGYETRRTQSVIVRENAKPVIDGFSGFYKLFDKTVDMNVKVDAYDPEGGVLTYKAKLESFRDDYSDYLQIDGSLFKISKNIPNGTYNLKIVVSDGMNNVEKNFEFRANSNTAPTDLVVKNGDIEIGETLRLKVSDPSLKLVASAVDAQNDPLSYEWTFNEGLGYADKDTFTINPVVGIFNIGVLVSDGKSSISKSFKIVIAQNLKPVVKSVTLMPKQIVKVGDRYEDGNGNIVDELTVTVDAYDPEGTKLTYKFGDIQTLELLAAGDETNNTKVYKLKDIPAGKSAIKIDVEDADGYVTTKRAIFEVGINKPPKIRTLFVPVKAKRSKEVKLQALAVDPEGKTLTYEWQVLDGTGAVTLFDKAASDTSFTVPANASDKLSVTLKVSDGTNVVTRRRIIEIVSNNAPVINLFKVLPTVVKEGKSVHFSAEVSDPDFDTLTYNWYLNDKLLEDFTDKSSGTITLDTPAQYTLRLDVSDGDKIATKSEKITVTALAAKPVVTLSTTYQTLLPGEKTTINALVEADGDYNLKWIGEGLSGENLTSAQFSSKILGEHKIGVIATNIDGIQSDEATISLTVKDIVAKLETPKATQEIGNDFLFTVTLSDETPVSTNISWKIVQKPTASTVVLKPNGVTALLTPDVVGTYKVEASFTVNGIAGEFKASKSVTVKDVNQSGETVEGMVKDASGEILEGVKVRLYNAIDSTLYDMSVTTDAEGKYSFKNVPAGEYYVVISGGNGYINQTQKITIQ